MHLLRQGRGVSGGRPTPIDPELLERLRQAGARAARESCDARTALDLALLITAPEPGASVSEPRAAA